MFSRSFGRTNFCAGANSRDTAPLEVGFFAERSGKGGRKVLQQILLVGSGIEGGGVQGSNGAQKTVLFCFSTKEKKVTLISFSGIRVVFFSFAPKVF